MQNFDSEEARTWISEALGFQVSEVVATYEAVRNDLKAVAIQVHRIAGKWMITAVAEDGARMTGQVGDDLRSTILTAHWYELEMGSRPSE